MAVTDGIHMKLNRPLLELKDRIRFAKFVAETIDRGPKKETPRLLNNNPGAYEFQLDENNDFFLVIDQDDTSLIAVNMRYNDPAVKKALLTWISYRWDGKAVVVAPEGAK